MQNELDTRSTETAACIDVVCRKCGRVFDPIGLAWHGSRCRTCYHGTFDVSIRRVGRASDEMSSDRMIADWEKVIARAARLDRRIHPRSGSEEWRDGRLESRVDLEGLSGWTVSRCFVNVSDPPAVTQPTRHELQTAETVRLALSA
mgnify:CR=1 FL=1